MSNPLSPTQSLTYKRIGDLKIELELYLPQGPNNAPVLLWFHGGGLLQGQRNSVAPHMLRGVQKYGFALISADCEFDGGRSLNYCCHQAFAGSVIFVSFELRASYAVASIFDSEPLRSIFGFII